MGIVNMKQTAYAIVFWRNVMKKILITWFSYFFAWSQYSELKQLLICDLAIFLSNFSFDLRLSSDIKQTREMM